MVWKIYLKDFESCEKSERIRPSERVGHRHSVYLSKVRVYQIINTDSQRFFVSQIEEFSWCEKQAIRITKLSPSLSLSLSLAFSLSLSLSLSLQKSIVYWLIIDGQIMKVKLKSLAFVFISINITRKISTITRLPLDEPKNAGEFNHSSKKRQAENVTRATPRKALTQNNSPNLLSIKHASN